MSVVQRCRVVAAGTDAGVGYVTHSSPRVADMLEETLQLILTHAWLHGSHHLHREVHVSPGVTGERERERERERESLLERERESTPTSQCAILLMWLV